jgi:hypothetical protein
MYHWMFTLGRIAGFLGAATFLAAITARLFGVYWFGGFQVGTLLQAGVAAMVFGCFLLLVVLAGRAVERGR